MAVEQHRFATAHPRSAALHETAKASLLDGVPMPWMIKWAGPFPPYVELADGAHVTCVDGHEYIDLCLGDTGAMAGHGPAPTIAAVEGGNCVAVSPTCSRPRTRPGSARN